jgi:BRCA1-associated protein
MASKLDAIAQEYNHLLASQLDSQRKYFEGQIAIATRQAEEEAAASAAEAAAMSENAMSATTEAKRAMNQVRDLKKKLEVSPWRLGLAVASMHAY